MAHWIRRLFCGEPFFRSDNLNELPEPETLCCQYDVTIHAQCRKFQIFRFALWHSISTESARHMPTTTERTTGAFIHQHEQKQNNNTTCRHTRKKTTKYIKMKYSDNNICERISFVYGTKWADGFSSENTENGCDWQKLCCMLLLTIVPMFCLFLQIF